MHQLVVVALSLVMAAPEDGKTSSRIGRTASLPDRAAPPSTVRNSIGMTLQLIPAGPFVMGSPASDPAADDREKPQRTVRIARPFYMGAHEVTVGQFQEFTRATGFRTSAEKDGHGASVLSIGQEEGSHVKRLTWLNPGYRQTLNDPVVIIDWSDAVAFCQWLSKKEGAPYRLPTEEEWEYACRAGTSTRWSCGDAPEKLVGVEWIAANSGGRVHPVGTKPPNPFGLHDMHGNVREWCSDLMTNQGVALSHFLAGNVRVVRGGDFCFDAARARSAYRGRSPEKLRFNCVGFRVCCDYP